MTFPIVTELPLELEPLSRDTFAESAPRDGDERAVTAAQQAVRRRVAD